MQLLRQETRTMKASGAEKQAVCVVKVFKGVGTATGKIVVIASDINERSVVTNKVEEIAADVCRRQKIKARDLIFIEHRRARHDFEETFDLVRLKWNESEGKFHHPQWSPFSREAAEAITIEKSDK